MTAIVAALAGHNAELWTDGLTRYPDGATGPLVSKVSIAGHIRTAIAIRADEDILPELAVATAGAPGFDEMVAHLPQIVRTVLARLDRPALEFEVVVAGWSEDHDRARVAVMLSDDAADKAGAAPWTVLYPSLYVAPAVPGEALHPRPGETLADHAMRIMELQRAGHGTGGFAQRTMIAPDGVKSGVTHVWPEDRPGQWTA
jgi:hypothetical protein